MKAMIWLGGPVLGFAIVAAASYSVKAERTVAPHPVGAVETVAVATDGYATDACCAAPAPATVAQASTGCAVDAKAHTTLASHDDAAACPHDATKAVGAEAAACPHHEGTLATKHAPASAAVVAEAN